MFSLNNILQILIARRWWLFLTMVLVTVLAILGAWKIAPSYTSSTSLMFDFPQVSALTVTSNQRQLGSDYLRTQVDIMRSPKVAARAFAALDPLHQRKLMSASATKNNDQARDQQEKEGIAALESSLEVSPSKDSRIIFVRAKSTSPPAAAAIADAVADAYIEVALELRIEPALRQASWYNEQLADLRVQLEVEQQELSDFQQRTGIINLDERLDSENQRLQQLNARLVEAQARTVDTESRQLGKRHPEYQRAIASENAIVEALDAQRTKLFSLKQERNELALLRQDLESSKATYNTALERGYDARLVSQLNQTNVAILSRAQVAERRETNLTLVVLLALGLGLLCGLTVALLIEMLDRRIHSDVDAAEALQLPVLGTI